MSEADSKPPTPDDVEGGDTADRDESPSRRGGWGARLSDLKLGDAVGGWVRRVSEMVEELSDQDRLSNEAKASWEPLRDQWHDEDFAGLIDGLDQPQATALPEALREQLLLLAAVHAKLVDDPQQATLAQRAAELDRAAEAAKTEASSAHRIWRAHRHLSGGRERAPANARDELRRAQSQVKHLSRPLRASFARLFALLSAQAWAAEGQLEKAARAIEDARALQEPADDSDRLSQRVDLVAVELWLGLDRLDEADRLSAELVAAVDRKAPRSDAQAQIMSIRARVCAARGQFDAARALRTEVGARLDPRDAVRLAIQLDSTEQAVELATQWLQGDPRDPARLRLWALAKVGPDASATLDPESRVAVVDALLRGLEAVTELAKEQRARELAFVALRQELPVPAHAKPATLDRLRAALREAGDLESFLFHTWLRAEAGEEIADRLDEAGRLRTPPPPAGASGPDELCPLRDVDLFERTLRSRGAYVAALAARARGDHAAAHALFVESLVEEPDFDAARRALADQRPYPDAARLEAVLTTMTERLGAMPQELLGVRVEGVASTLEATIAARERLARPLTIAIMGEFSAGKSTFVNAWLGRALAPMGALPTTCTINVFRRGGQGHARVHRSNGQIQHVDASQVAEFLSGLDETAAAEIRHVEIERGDAGFGDATVVDTPGLNALDPYHERVAREFLAEADAIVWIFSATRGAAESERAMLEELRGDGRKVLGVLNKADVLEPDEQRELMDYLRERLGDVLVDVVPLCATEALAKRLDPKSGEAPLADIEASLETHFLGKARALKTGVVRRRLLEALGEGRNGVATSADRLDAQAGRVHTYDAQALRVRLQGAGDLLTKSFGELSDLLMRELLSMGVAVVGDGKANGRPTSRDIEYVGRRLTLELQDTVRALAVSSADSNDAELMRLVTTHAMPWLSGYVSAALEGGALERWIEQAAGAAKDGERSMREQLRLRLIALGERLTETLRELDRAAAAAYAAAARRRGGRPRAEALRLRVVVDGALAQAADAVEKSGVGDEL